MKSYTDIKQSRKLVEILPLESADMCYIEEDALRGYHMETVYAVTLHTLYHDKKCIPCWSLAALLSVLPFPSLHKTFMGYRCDSYNEEGTTCKLGESADNPVDACYEMIIRLNELNLL